MLKFRCKKIKFSIGLIMMALCLLLQATLGMLQGAYAATEVSKNRITISGYLENPQGTEEVSIDVFFPGKGYEHLKYANSFNISTILLRRDQVTAKENGFYSLSFSVGDIPSGKYTAYIGRSGSGDVKTEVVNYVNPKDAANVISCSKFGNIFYTGDTVMFDISVPAVYDFNDVNIKYTVKTYDGETVYQAAGKPVSQKAAYVIENFSKVGVFDLIVDIYSDSTGQLLLSEKKDFSHIKSGVKKNSKVAVHEITANDTEYSAYISDIMNQFKKNGFSGGRTGIPRNGSSWNSNGTLNYQTEYYNVMDYYTASKTEGLVILSGSNTVWGHMPVTESELLDFKKYCACVANDTKDFAVAYEIWNEPNASGFNKDGATTAQYAKLIQAASEAIKSANPSAKVIAMATSGCDSNWIKNTIDGAAEQGINLAACIDGVSIHPYMWAHGPEKGQMTEMQKIRTLMDNNGLADKELWATEVGWQRTLGLDRQAYYSVNYLLLNDVCGVADKSYFFRYVGTMPANSNEEFDFLNDGAADVPFSARPNFVAVSNYNRIMSDAVYETTLTQNGIDIYKFKLSDGSYALAYYCENKNGSICVDLGVNEVTVSDVYGNEKKLYSANGVYNLDTLDGANYVTGDFTKFAAATSSDSISVTKTVLEEDEAVTLTVKSDCDAEVNASENVSVVLKSQNGAEKVYSVSVKDFDADKTFVDVMLSENGKTKVQKRFMFKEAYGDDVIYHADRYNYGGYYRWNLYNTDFSEQRKQAFRLTANSGNPAVLYTNLFELNNSTANSNNKYKVSFDFMSEDMHNMQTVFATGEDMQSTSIVFPGIFLTEDGRIGYHRDRYYQDKVYTSLTYDINVWYNAEAVIDFTNKTIVYYINGNKIGEVSNYPFSTLKQVRFSDTSKTSGTLWIDNIEVKQLNTKPLEITLFDENVRISSTEKTPSVLGSLSQAVIIGAVYDKDGRLLSTETKNVSKSQLQNNSVYADIDIPSGGYKVKAFIFDSFSELRPLYKVYTKKIK